jgi:hypothetical protein
VRSRASTFRCEYHLLSLRSSSSFLRLLPRLPATYVPPFIFPSTTCCRRQFLRKMWPIQLAFRLFISCRIFLCSLTLSNTSTFLTWSVQMVFSILLQHHISKLSKRFWSTARSAQMSLWWCFYATSNNIPHWCLLAKRPIFWSNVTQTWSSKQILIKFPSIKFLGNPSNGRHSWRRTDMKITRALHDYVSAPKKYALYRDSMRPSLCDSLSATTLFP